MSPSHENLRLTVGLAHFVPGARLHLHCANGQLVVAGNDHAADLDLCCMRRVVLVSSTPGQPDHTKVIEHIEVCGSLTRIAPGIYCTTQPEGNDCWFASPLPPSRVDTVIKDLELPGLDPDVMNAQMFPDDHLGITAVRIRANDTQTAKELIDISIEVNLACLVEEVLIETHNSGLETPRSSN